MKTSVSIGATTVVGWVTAALALLPSVIESIKVDEVALNGPNKWLAIAGIVIGAVTQIGRYAQAHALIKAGKAA
jgi:hypothetical protein